MFFHITFVWVDLMSSGLNVLIFNGHSFKKGAARTAAYVGISDSHIQTMEVICLSLLHWNTQLAAVPANSWQYLRVL